MEEGANYFLHKQDAKKLYHKVTLQNVLPVIVAFFSLIKMDYQIDLVYNNMLPEEVKQLPRKERKLNLAFGVPALDSDCLSLKHSSTTSLSE